MIVKILLFINLILCGLSFAQDKLEDSASQKKLTVVAVGEAGVLKEGLLIELQDIKQTSLLAPVRDVIASDFAFYKKKFDTRTGNISGSSLANLESLKNKNLNYYLNLDLIKQNDVNRVSYKLISTATEQVLLQGVEDLKKSSMRNTGHVIANAVFQNITGKKSIFLTNIVFVSDMGSTSKKTVKELYVMDFDGHNAKRLTQHHGIVISPSLSSDNKKIVYSLISNTNIRNRNVDLFLYDMNTGTSKLISSQKGLNSGAVFWHEDKEILLTLSHVGNAEIFSMNLETKELRRITNNYAPDVDASTTPDGKLMTFLSGRPGRAEIYLMDPSGMEKDVRRISYVGDFNATPRFSPDGKEIVFSSWMDNAFDLFRISSEGRGLARLTKNFGSNEDPSYSNDGQFIVFTSQRVISRSKAVWNLYTIDRDGEFIGQLTQNYGNCTSPRWSN